MAKCEPGCQCRRHTAKMGFRPKPGIQRRCEEGCTCGRHTVPEERREGIRAALTGRKLTPGHIEAVRRGATRHGESGKGRNDDSPTYISWRGMRDRCATGGKYHGRVSVCARWHSFESFLEDMGQRPEGLTLDRIDNDGDYEPGNCRWATAETQANNRRPARQKVEV